MQARKQQYANHELSHILAPGLFRSIRKGERVKNKLDITYKLADESIRFWGPEPLGADDMRVLQGLVALASTQYSDVKVSKLTSEPLENIEIELRQRLKTNGGASDQECLIVQSSFRRLAQEIGYKDSESGTRFKSLQNCLDRLWAVSVLVVKDGKKFGYRILSEYSTDDEKGALNVAVNPRLAAAIMGRTNYARVDMAEVRALKTDPARLLHQRLHMIRPGRSQNFHIDTLCNYVWPDKNEKIKPATLRKRYQVINISLNELADLSWAIEKLENGIIQIRRPKPIFLAEASDTGISLTESQ